MSATSACAGFDPDAPTPKSRKKPGSGNGRSNAGGVPAKTLLSLSTASITPAQVGSPKGSSDSSSDSSGRGGGGPGPPQGPPVCGGPLSPHAHAMSVGVG